MPRSQRSIRALLVGPALVALLPLLTGCSSAVSEQPSTTLVVWGLEFGEETMGLQARVHEFERRHPGVKVSVLSMGAGNMNPQKLLTAIVGGVPPDVIRQDRFTIGDWASRQCFLPLDSLILRDSTGSNAVRRRDYYKPCWDEATYQGKLFAVPETTDDRALYYNRTLFRKVGLNPDKPPRTWDELKDYAKRLTSFNTDGSNYNSIGFIPNFGNSWLYLYSWQNGGDFMSPDGRTCTMNNKYSVAALQYMVELYDMLGGVNRVTSFASGFQANDLDPFLTGKVAMKVDGNWVLNSIARYRPDLDFGVVPAPVPSERLLTGSALPARFRGQPTDITWAGGFSYAIPTGAKHKQLGWEFIKWMTSPEAELLDATTQRAYNITKSRPFVPPLSANIVTNRLVLARFAPVAPRLRTGLRFFVKLLPNAKFRPVTFVGQRLWDEHVRAFDQATHHSDTGKTAQQAMDEGTRVVQTELDKAFHVADHPLLSPLVPTISSAILFLGIAALAVRQIITVRRMGQLGRKEAIAGFLFAGPWVFGFVLFTAGPILAALLMSLCNYDVLHPPRFVGLLNYSQILTTDGYYLKTALFNVFYLALIGIPLGICTGLSLAMLLNTKVKGMSFYRTCFYMPSIVPVVASAVLWAWVLNGDANRGLLDALWKSAITPWSHVTPPGWFGAAAWAKPGLIVQGLWGAGGGMILWLAGLQGIPQHLYEAADIDGAGVLSKFINVTLPMLSPYIFFNLIMGTITALQEFDRIYILAGMGGGGSSVGPVDSMLVPVVYLFNNAFMYFKMGYASALAWVLFVIILTLSALQLRLAKRWVYYEADRN